MFSGVAPRNVTGKTIASREASLPRKSECMPLPTDSLRDDERHNFCRRLKIMRERKGITLAAIADATKIRGSLFASFEQNDLRGWPQGLYRRAYFREYAKHFDDRLDESCEEFNKLFTDEPHAATPSSDAAPAAAVRAPDADLRLVFDAKWHGPRTPVLTRLAAVAADIVLVAILSGVMMLASGFDATVTIAAVALAYFSLGTTLFGESPSIWMIAHREAILSVFGDAPDKPAEEQVQETSEPRPWVSDATRVGPAPPSQLRVRFKV